MPALFHVEFGIVGRTSGHSAVKRSAYQACACREDGEGRVYDWRRKRDEWTGGFVLAPDGAPDWATDAARLWRKAEAAERRCDAQLARTIEISIPRAVPPDLRVNFARFVLAPLRDMGMVIQADLHCPLASTGGEQPHLHAVLTLRSLDGAAFGKKNRDWNTAFTKDAGRAMRGLLAERMNAFFRTHGIESTVDHRRTEAGPGHVPPEANVPRSAWAAWKADPTAPAAAPVREVQALRRHRHQHCAAVVMAEAAEAEFALLSGEARRRTPGFAPANHTDCEERRRRVLAGLLRQHYDTGWLPETVVKNIHSVHLDTERQRAVITLHDGSRFVDYGDRITLRGPITRTAAAEIAAAAARYGWTTVVLTGPTAFKDAVAVECALREPPIRTDHILTLEARKRLESLRQNREKACSSAERKRMALAVLSNEITRLEAALSSAPVHIARPMAARLAEARTAILLVCRGDFKIIDAAVRGDIMVAHTMPNLHNAAAPKFAQQITSAEIETAPTGKLTV